MTMRESFSDVVATRKPVDRTALRMIMKSPWWAHPPIEHQKALVKNPPQVKIEDMVDIFRPPPRRGRRVLKDRRGTVLQKKTGGGSVSIILGFSREVEKYYDIAEKKPPWWVGEGWDSRRKNKVKKSTFYWWATRNGEIVEVKFRKSGIGPGDTLKVIYEPPETKP